MTRFRLFLIAGLAVTASACAPADDAPAAEAPADMSADSAAPMTDATAPSALIDPETASAEEIAAVPGLNAEIAERIVAARPIENMLEVDAILAASLDETQRDSVYAHLFKPLDLNTATGEEIQLIPGVGDRMEHEFEEYRPYRGIEQFRSEIGKYVDDEEVARLEQYVTINE